MLAFRKVGGVCAHLVTHRVDGRFRLLLGNHSAAGILHVVVQLAEGLVSGGSICTRAGVSVQPEILFPTLRLLGVVGRFLTRTDIDITLDLFLRSSLDRHVISLVLFG